MVTRIIDGVAGIIRAWRYHFVVPRTRAEFWRLVREGPTPIDPDTHQPMPGHNRPPGAFELGNFDLGGLLDGFLVEYDREPPKPYHGLVCVLDIPDLDKNAAWSLYQNGYVSVTEVRNASRDRLAELPGISAETLDFLDSP
jgi:hypothetical protein